MAFSRGLRCRYPVTNGPNGFVSNIHSSSSSTSDRDELIDQEKCPHWLMGVSHCYLVAYNGQSCKMWGNETMVMAILGSPTTANGQYWEHNAINTAVTVPNVGCWFCVDFFCTKGHIPEFIDFLVVLLANVQTFLRIQISQFANGTPLPDLADFYSFNNPKIAETWGNVGGDSPFLHTNEHHHSSDITTGGHDQIQPDQYPLISQYILDVNRIGCFKKLTSSYILSTSFKKMFNNSTKKFTQLAVPQCHRPTNPMEHWCMTDSDPGLTSDSAKSQQKKMDLKPTWLGNLTYW